MAGRLIYVGLDVGGTTMKAAAVDDAGKTLTLETEGPCPLKPGQRCKFKEVIEVKDKDHKVFTSSMQGDDGKYTTMLTINYRRKK